VSCIGSGDGCDGCALDARAESWRPVRWKLYAPASAKNRFIGCQLASKVDDEQDHITPAGYCTSRANDNRVLLLPFLDSTVISVSELLDSFAKRAICTLCCLICWTWKQTKYPAHICTACQFNILKPLAKRRGIQKMESRHHETLVRRIRS